MTADADAYMTSAVESALAMLRQRYERDLHNQLAKEAAGRVPALRQARDEAIWHLYHDEHQTTTAIAEALRAALLDRGVTEDNLRWAGISHDTVFNIASRGDTEES